MNIVHISPNCSYHEGWSYQENLLPHYQAKQGHTVTLLTSTRQFDQYHTFFGAPSDTITSDGFRVIRYPFRRALTDKFSEFLAILPVRKELDSLQPDLIFFHGIASFTIFQAAAYQKRHPDCVIVMDNHLDYNIGYDIRQPMTLPHRMIQAARRWMYRKVDPHITKVYGVTPWRVTYAHEAFGVPMEKLDLLLMGADDENIDFAHRDEIRHRIRAKYGIDEDTFLVVTGGKLDEKKGTHLLLEATKGLEGVNVLVFGKASEEYQAKLDACSHEAVRYAGWISGSEVYDYFFAADLVCFPGQHSVLWEQACAAKVPCLIKHWEGMEHVDQGGNTELIDDVSPENLRRRISALRFTPAYAAMQKAASDITDVFLYSKIAEKSVETVEKGRTV